MCENCVRTSPDEKIDYRQYTGPEVHIMKCKENPELLPAILKEHFGEGYEGFFVDLRLVGAYKIIT